MAFSIDVNVPDSMYKGALTRESQNRSRDADLEYQNKLRAYIDSQNEAKADQEALNIFQRITSESGGTNINEDLQTFQKVMTANKQALRGIQMSGKIYEMYQNNPQTKKIKDEISKSAILLLTLDDAQFKKQLPIMYKNGMKQGFGPVLSEMGINSDADAANMTREQLASKILDPKIYQEIVKGRMNILRDKTDAALGLGKGGRGGGGGAQTALIKTAEYMFNNKFKDPKTDQPIATKERALQLADQLLDKKGKPISERALKQKLLTMGVSPSIINKRVGDFNRMFGDESGEGSTEGGQQANDEWEEIKPNK